MNSEKIGTLQRATAFMANSARDLEIEEEFKVIERWLPTCDGWITSRLEDRKVVKRPSAR